MPLIDSFGRTIDYLRVSVTDRCNLRCVYCMPLEGADVAPKADLLTFEELSRLVRLFADLGVTKVRLTGGEPLIRKDIATLTKLIGSIPQIKDLSLTTNGYLLPKLAVDLAQGGLNRVNISLDTLKPERFQAIARKGSLEDVLDGIEAAQLAGISPIKLNMVVMRGINDDEVADFAHLTLEQPFNVRFIELMPINWSSGTDEMRDYFSLAGAGNPGVSSPIQLSANSTGQGLSETLKERSHTTSMLDGAAMRRLFVRSSETRERIEERFGDLTPADVVTNGPASSFRIAGALGTVGFISQITNDICPKCNRLRLTADGFLRPCLMADGEADLRTPLRNGASDKEIAEIIRRVVYHKPYEHRLEDEMAPTGRSMSQIGG